MYLCIYAFKVILFYFDLYFFWNIYCQLVTFCFYQSNFSTHHIFRFNQHWCSQMKGLYCHITANYFVKNRTTEKKVTATEECWVSQQGRTSEKWKTVMIHSRHIVVLHRETQTQNMYACCRVLGWCQVSSCCCNTFITHTWHENLVSLEARIIFLFTNIDLVTEGCLLCLCHIQYTIFTNLIHT